MSFDFCGTLTFGAVHDKDVSEAVSEVGHTLEETAEDAVHAVEDAAEAVGEGIKDAAEAVADGLEDAAEAVADGITEAANYSLHQFEDFGNQMVDGLENQVINPMGHAMQDLGSMADDAWHQAEECARVGLAAVAEGAAVVGGAVVDAATSIGEGIEDAAVQTANAVKSAAAWVEEVGETAIDTLQDGLDGLGHTLESALNEVRKACVAFIEELKAIADFFINLFKDLANLTKALDIKEVLDTMLDWGWGQLERAVDLLLGLGPAVLKEGRDNPKLRGVRAMVVGFQPVLDGFLDQTESALGPLHADNQAMQLLRQVMDQAERLFSDLEAALLSTLRSYGLETGALDELLHIFDPMLHMVFGVIGSNPIALDLGELYDTIADALAALGDWLEKWVVNSIRSVAHSFLHTLRSAFQAEVYVPGVSELYSLVTLTMTGQARHLSLQEALTLPIAYFIHVSYRVMAGKDLNPPKAEMKSWLASLPDLPTATAVVRFFEEVLSGTVDAGSAHRLFGAETGQRGPGKLEGLERSSGIIKVARGSGSTLSLPKMSDVAAFATNMVLSFLEVVGLILTGFEFMAVTIVGGVLVGIVTTVRGFLRLADLLASSYSDARTALEITLMGFELSGLPRSIALSIASAREAKELSKLAVAILAIVDLVLVAMEKMVSIALESLKHAGESPPTSDKAFAAAYADASATLLSTVIFAVAPIAQIVDDPVMEIGEAGAAAPETDGIGAVVTPVATKLTRVLDVLGKVAVGLEVARVFTGIEIAVSDSPA